jgi:hypothetical protein
MINLIPNEEKKKKVKDFYFRLTVVVLMLLGFTMVLGSVAILPAYFFSSVKKNLYNTKLETEKKETVALFNQNTLDTINDIKNKLSLIERTNKDPYLVSEKVINQILLKKMSDIKITGITYESTADKGKIITIAGTAVSRERLLLFKKALEDDVAFTKVDLPISNLVRGANIKFSMTLIPL